MNLFTFPTIPRYHLNLTAFECWAKTVLFDIFDGPIDQFSDVINAHNLAYWLSIPRRNKMMKYGGEVARTAADV